MWLSVRPAPPPTVVVTPMLTKDEVKVGTEIESVGLVVLKRPLAVHVCGAVQVGTMAWLNAGAASERIAVLATPLAGVRPMRVLGLAKPDMGKVAHVAS